MNTETKLIKNKLGLLKLSEELGNVSQACKYLGYSRDTFIHRLRWLQFCVRDATWHKGQCAVRPQSIPVLLPA